MNDPPMGLFSPTNSSKVIEISDDEEEITASTEQNNLEFYSNEMKTWINIENKNDWALVDFDCSVDYIFRKLRDKFFSTSSIDSAYVAQFDNDNSIIDGSAFKIFERSKRIVVSRSILTRPRIQQISMILHAIIHLFLNKASNGQIGINKHEENFRGIMHHLNEVINTSITISHKFGYHQDEEDYPKHWWMCSGNCQHYQPFKGIIRCTTIPSETMLFWRSHHQKCPGTFFKVFEIQKTNSLDEVDKKYVRHTCYLNPPAPNNNNSQHKAHPAQLPIRAKVDLTSDVSSPVVFNLCDIVDLDESQYNIIDEAIPNYFEEYKKFSLNFNSCPFCLHFIGTSRLSSHFDVCLGHQDEVNHCIQLSKSLFYRNVN